MYMLRGPHLRCHPAQPHRACARFVTRATSGGTEATPTASPSVPLASPDYKNIGPNPQRFAVAEGQTWPLLAASSGSLFRLGTGLLVHGYKSGLEQDDGRYSLVKASGRKLSETTTEVAKFNRPAVSLELYEFEACPYCKKVREAIGILDLDVLVRPCPKDGPTYRPQVAALGGKSQFPYLVDPNTGKSMYESDDIITYLFREYGPGEDAIPSLLRPGFLTNLSAGLSALPRSGYGRNYRPARKPAQPLVVWGYEVSPFVKLVREKLSELELPYNYICTARGSPKRQVLFEKRGHFQVPYLEDPNEEVYMFESAAIVKYLEDKYALPA